MELTFIVEQVYGSLPDLKHKVLLERSAVITDQSITVIIESLHLLFSKINHRVIVKYDCYEI